MLLGVLHVGYVPPVNDGMTKFGSYARHALGPEECLSVKEGDQHEMSTWLLNIEYLLHRLQPWKVARDCPFSRYARRQISILILLLAE